MMDYDSNFIEYDDEEAINSRLGSRFIVLKQTHFIAHYEQQQDKCSYSCRNRVMKQLISDNPWTRYYYDYLEIVDDVLCSREPPYLLFTNECVRGSHAEDGSIIANYTTVDIRSFAEITKSKQCDDRFFMVNLGDDQYLCCNIQTLKIYKYHACVRYCFLLSIYCGEPEDQFKELDSAYEELKSLTPLPKHPNFILLDIEGNPVEENTEYHLGMCDFDDGFLDFSDGKLSRSSFDNKVEILAVKYSIVHGIHYLTYNNKYLHVADGIDEISLTDQLPKKHQRLQFIVTERNTFMIFKWNQRVWFDFETSSGNYSALQFEDEKLFISGTGLQAFFLKRV
ncbi:hypothetical protein INT44_003385 [Umbelopsis vinacea]|uniref:Uncharacterized protein n=1 Tax=Umbelopsis vinacea TaxID=44442 RepID=A0A8H7UHU0_9FUNG|nr:hypothetical protein INT44_003385 [Umbelopsis vinacea]